MDELDESPPEYRGYRRHLAVSATAGVMAGLLFLSPSEGEPRVTQSPACFPCYTGTINDFVYHSHDDGWGADWVEEHPGTSPVHMSAKPGTCFEGISDNHLCCNPSGGGGPD